jgi:hypothetical protein
MDKVEKPILFIQQLSSEPFRTYLSKRPISMDLLLSHLRTETHPVSKMLYSVVFFRIPYDVPKRYVL